MKEAYGRYAVEVEKLGGRPKTRLRREKQPAPRAQGADPDRVSTRYAEGSATQSRVDAGRFAAEAESWVGLLVQATGGKVLYVGDVSFLMLGRADSLWDEVALVEYPSRTAFLAITMSAQWQTIGVHREAGLAGQLNIETVPTPMTRR